MPSDESDRPGLFRKIGRRMTLSVQIVIALLLGITAGLFFGEYCAPLSVLGDAFVGLLRMTVLPYIMVTLTASLGRLSIENSRRLALLGGTVLCCLWAICLVLVWLLPSCFPSTSEGSFFSMALIEQPVSTDWLSFFIPANIFRSLAENDVPAIVLFAILFGFALGRAKERDALIGHLHLVGDVLMTINRSIAKLVPLGIFAIAASASGTASIDEFARLQAYLVVYTCGALFLGFVALPLLVTTFTPLSYRQVLSVVREPMLTAFATGKLVIVIPMLIENTDRLIKQSTNFAENGINSPSTDAFYGIAYPFPHVGKLLSMLFIPFAAWFTGASMNSLEYPVLLISGLFAFFGGPIVGIPFLLDQARLPHDMFQLFLVTGVYGERVGDAIGAMHLCVFSLISLFAFNRQLKFPIRRIVRHGLLATFVGFLMMAGARGLSGRFIGVAESRADVLDRLQLIESPTPNVIINPGEPNPDPLRFRETLLERIRRRRTIRIGFNEDEVPFAFFNRRGELVGYDIDMAHRLASDLGVRLEFVRFNRKTLIEQLQEDHFDVVMSGLVGTIERVETIGQTVTYLDVNLGLAVPDYRAQEFATIDAIHDLEHPVVGFTDLSRAFVARLENDLRNATIVEIPNNRDFFLGKHPNIDALLINAESGSAYTLMHPEYEVVMPSRRQVREPLIYAVGNRDAEMKNFLEHWTSVRRKDGTSEDLYDHWILGKPTDDSQPRWSVIRNVLHWVD